MVCRFICLLFTPVCCTLTGRSRLFNKQRVLISGTEVIRTKSVGNILRFRKHALTFLGYDLYRPEINDELQMYFDRCTKGIDNGWERSTPRVRLSLLGFEGSPAKTVIERLEEEYPLQRQQLKTYFLDASSQTLTSTQPDIESSASYEGHHLTDCLVS